MRLPGQRPSTGDPAHTASVPGGGRDFLHFDLSAELEERLGWEGTFLQARGDRCAFLIFHHQLIGAVLVPEVVKGADGGVAAAEHCASLALYSSPIPPVPRGDWIS